MFDPDVNYSDYLPLVATLPCPLLHKVAINSKESEPIQTFLRWDKADRQQFYDYTGCCLAPLIDEAISCHVLSRLLHNFIYRVAPKK